MIKNPILPGFNPDPCICRKDDDYYIAVSSFEWFPGIPVYHSRDMKNWELYTHVLTDDETVDLKTSLLERYMGAVFDMVRNRESVLCCLRCNELNECRIF